MKFIYVYHYLECFARLLSAFLYFHVEQYCKYCICYFVKVIAIAVIIKTFINGRKKNIEDLKPAVHISTSQKPSNRATLKSVKRNETEKNLRKNSSASKPNTMTYMQKKPSVTLSSSKSQQKSSAVDSSQQKVKSQGAKQPTVKQSKQPTSKQTTTAKPTTKPPTSKQPAGKQATTKTQKVTDKTKTLTRKSRKNV